MRSQNATQILGTLGIGLVVPLFLLATAGCVGDGPTGTAPAEVTLSQAKITVADQPLAERTVHRGEQSGTVHYEARLVDRHGEPASGYQVRVRVELPGMMGPMHHMTQEFYCHDDGTHGDPVPGDGVYCYDDTSQEYGCHQASAAPGDYHYDFCGIGHDGHESNHMDLKVSLLP